MEILPLKSKNTLSFSSVKLCTYVKGSNVTFEVETRTYENRYFVLKIINNKYPVSWCDKSLISYLFFLGILQCCLQDDLPPGELNHREQNNIE